MSPVSLSLMLLFALQISQSQSVLVPAGFACTKDKPRSSIAIYSIPPAAGFVRVDLIHILCGQIRGNHASGFHARPGNIDPPSASTVGPETIQIKAPVSSNDIAVYQNPRVYDKSTNKFVVKNTISGIWPTSMTMEKIVKAITYLARDCG